VRFLEKSRHRLDHQHYILRNIYSFNYTHFTNDIIKNTMENEGNFLGTFAKRWTDAKTTLFEIDVVQKHVASLLMKNKTLIKSYIYIYI